MGSDCLIQLPGNVRVKDVANILAILDGVPAMKYVHSSGVYWAQVAAKAEGIPEIAGCARITWTGLSGPRHVLYHFEPDVNIGGRLLMPRSTAWWIAAGTRLVQFFGGNLVYNDCGDQTPDISWTPQSNWKNCPSSGKAWDDFQDRLLSMKPLTDQEIQDVQKHAVYITNAINQRRRI